jgi:ferredoxin
MSTVAVPGFVQEIRAYGRFDTEGCLNCGSCTVVCALSNGHASFPRRPIQQALLGLKSSLRAALEPWLCYDCGDCATTCPRQTEPRESMMTLRRYLVSQYDVTGISSHIFRSRAWEIAAMAVVAAIVLGLVFLYHLYYVEMPVEDFVTTPFGLEHMFPLITYFTYVVFLLPISILAINAFRMYRWTMAGSTDLKIPFSLYLKEARTFFLHLFSHRKLKQCNDDKQDRRWIRHLVLGTGTFMMCVIVVFFLSWFQTDALYPLYHPQRWLGYLATAAMIVVPIQFIVSRVRKRGVHHKFSETTDLVFPAMLILVAVSGIAVHIFRYADMALACHYGYAVHLAITVPLLLIELPFGKWSHVIYRPLALYLQSVRERAIGTSPAEVKLKEDEVLKGTQPT